MRKHLTFASAITLLMLATIGLAQPNPRRQARPNIVFILIDDLRWDELSLAGHPYLELNGMDELYDLKADPYEMKNLIQQPGAARTLAAMKREMEQLLQETAAKPKN